MSVNEKRISSMKMEKATEDTHKNFMGGTSYDIKNPILRLACMSASSFFGEPMYYKGQNEGPSKKNSYGYASRISDSDKKYLSKVLNSIDNYEWSDKSPKDSMVTAIREALAFDPVKTLEWAVVLRNEENIRVTPQIILVEAANAKHLKGSGIVRDFAKKIIKRADEPSTQLAYQLQTFGKPIPNALKKAWADYLRGASDYELAKYRMEKRVVKTVDVANLAFGSGFYGYETAIGQLMRDDLKLSDDLKTWESIRSAGGKWEDAIKVMGHMALLRNIRNFVENQVDKNLWVDKLVATAASGKQFPFRYLSAFNMNKSAPGHVLDAIEQCLEVSVGQLPRLKGRSLVLSDNSGSAHGAPISNYSTMTVAQIGNLMGVITAKASDEGVLGVFGDRLEYVNIRKNASTFDQATKANEIGKKIGGGTENGVWLALDDAIRNKLHWDNIFIYSDMQAGHGGLYGINPAQYKNYVWHNGDRYIDVAKLIHDYRKHVNPKVNVFLVQTAGYEDTLVPEFFDRTYILGGWSEGIIKFASRINKVADEYLQ